MFENLKLSKIIKSLDYFEYWCLIRIISKRQTLGCVKTHLDATQQ